MHESIVYGQLANAYAFETITPGASTALPLTAAKLTPTTAGGIGKKACRVTVSCETEACRFRYDGTAPTSAVGHPLAVGERAVFEGTENLANLKFISQTGTSSLSITYEHFANKI